MNSNIKKGFFITLEGIEGAGKSTHIPFITDLIKKAGREIITTREPGGTVLGEKIRDILLSDGSLTINNDTELLLMFAARS
ncbi:MAG: dTMP kinase, partial [Gammaproteobacteria bacterium]